MQYTVSVDNVRVYNGFLCVDPHCMLAYIELIRSYAEKIGFKYKRSALSWIHEWRAHNWMYKHKIKIDRTKDVDLNENESLLKRVGYFIISNFISRIFI